MFGLFKKQSLIKKDEPVVEVKEFIKKEYPQVVQDIHHEFFNAGQSLLLEAQNILRECEQKDLDKGKRLASVGFVNTPQAKTAIESENKILVSQEIANLVSYYAIHYPNNKFITEEQVMRICEKYGLVFGETSLYRGFVPEFALSKIESFKIKSEDKKIEIWSKGVYAQYEGELLDDGGASAIRWASLYKKEKVEAKIKICAPIKDMEIPKGKEVRGYKIQDIPDPVVLQPVKGGYLIICAWGDEASDEIVVNQQMN